MCESCGVPLFTPERRECWCCAVGRAQRLEELARLGAVWTGRPQWALDRMAAWDYHAYGAGLDVELFRG